MLERHIAVNLPARTSIPPRQLQDCIPQLGNFAERLTRFVNLMLGSSESPILLRGDILKLVFLPPDIDTPPPVRHSADDPVFEVVVRQRRDAQGVGADVVGGRGFLFGAELSSQTRTESLGCLAVGDAAMRAS